MENLLKNTTVYNVVIVDNQEFWMMPTDYIFTATGLNEAKQLLAKWLNFNYDVRLIDDELNDSIEIWECQTNTLADPKRISVNLKQLMNDYQA